jgi:predicted RNA-binding protein with PUA-like domain
VDVRLLEKFHAVIATKVLKADPVTAELSIFQQGRLSVAPLAARQWQAVQKMKDRQPR